MGEFLSVVLTVVIVVYFAGLAGRYLLQWWIKRKMRQFGGDGSTGGAYFWGRGWGGGNARGSAEKEGTVKVTKTTRESRTVDKNIGEYVEYEEIEENEK